MSEHVDSERFDYLWHVDQDLFLMPPQASLEAVRSDAVFFAMVGVSALIVLLVAVLLTWFCLRYRAGSNADRGHRPAAKNRHRLEISLGLSMFLIFMGFFFWSVPVYLDLYRGPEDALTINVVGKQWMWRVYHPNGIEEINSLHVPVGQPIRLRITAQDVIHSFFVPAFRLKRDAVPGMYTNLWFTATKPGTYRLFCSEYCGSFHSRMRGRIVVMTQSDYQRWLTRHGSEPSPAAAGKQLFQAYGCSGCHLGRSSVRAPSLAGIYGRPVPLANGTTIIADEAYLHDSIVRPVKHIVAGYAPIMPSFAGQISEGEILKIIAYIKSLEPGDWEQGPVQRSQ